MLRYLFVLLALAVVSGSAAAQEKPRTGGELVRLKWPSASFLTALASPFNCIYKADILAKDIRWSAGPSRRVTT